GQYSPETMQSELFGHVKGAFTNAINAKIGVLRDADGDTLFLDEIGDLKPDLQRLLIKAIEEKQYRPLGSNDPERSDFRLISATNLDEAQLNLRLDPDFRDRINGLTLRLPPLREIPEELDWLWDSTFAEAARRAGVDPRRIHLADVDHRRI